MNTKLSTLLLSVIFGLTACSVDDTSITPSDNPDDISWEKPDYTSVKCDDPVFISDGIKPEVRSALDTYLTNITSLDEAMVAVVKPEDIGTYEGKLKAFYVIHTCLLLLTDLYRLHRTSTDILMYLGVGHRLLQCQNR